ncbi:MAG: CDP-alcohol phosphatidyltransferase family protein [Candidatus Aminicenantes bacterium]|nr:CDP-alcohol phosphatidyltransferase family protein [Candidatus Aminicenantes bacterium]
MPFKAKDLFTLFNLLAALFSVILSIEGHIALASKIILLCWLLDGLDGLVANLTKSANRFGAEFDNLVDLFSFSIAPGFVIYAFFIAYSRTLAVALCFYIIAAGTIRLARFNTKPLKITGYWIGFPRPASGLFIVFLLSSKIVLVRGPYLEAVPLILVVGLLNLTYVPYISNKANLTNTQTAIVFIAPISSMLLYPFGYMWDLGLFWMIVYILSPWISVKKQKRAEIKSIVAEWKRSQAS